MKILIAGASGAIGRPLISRLVAAGHDVVGITTSEHGLQTIKENGAKGVVANALDAQSVRLAMNEVRPDAVIDELTSLPKHYTPEEMRAAAGRDRTIRLEGGRNLYDAARATGARRYIVQSTGFFYAPGSRLATETEPLAIPPRVSEADALQTAGPDWIYYSTRLRGASNVKAKRELRFAPRRLEWLTKQSGAA